MSSKAIGLVVMASSLHFRFRNPYKKTAPCLCVCPVQRQAGRYAGRPSRKDREWKGRGNQQQQKLHEKNMGMNVSKKKRQLLLSASFCQQKELHMPSRSATTCRQGWKPKQSMYM
mmetsp:Transcript_10181/g.22146  ORF Transcript_10181/g.22146 Transcript_10181/m.22146 type:complete len:115 (-) Transcript_10181:1867-2211(-)